MAFPHAGPPATDDAGPQEPRIYAVTGGRTRADHALHLETQLVAGPARTLNLSPEAAEALAAWNPPSVSVAEIAAAIRRPVWVAKVLISDLIDAGALFVPPSSSADPGRDRAVLLRVLQGLKDKQRAT